MYLKYINKKLNTVGVKYAEKIVSISKAKQRKIKCVDEKQLGEMKTVAETINRRSIGMKLTSPCLCKSILCYKRLIRKHYDVEMKFGFKTYPFEAHVWVEYHGMVINDSEEYVKKYIVFE